MNTIGELIAEMVRRESIQAKEKFESALEKTISKADADELKEILLKELSIQFELLPAV